MSQLQESMNEERCNQIRQSITLTNPQLLELTYDQEKFLQKLDDLNSKGCEALSNQSQYEASIYFAEAERILQYAAGCGKTIQRALITTILNNEASVYQRSWELEKSSSYVEAIIYNISQFLEAFGQFKYTPDIIDEYSPEHAELATYLQRKLKLAVYHLQYCAISSQIKNHDTAFKSASKSIKLLQSFCQELNKYEMYHGEEKGGEEVCESEGIARVLKQLMLAKEVHITQQSGAFEKYLGKAKHYIRLFDRRIAEYACPEKMGNEFRSFMVGQFMQIELLGLSDKVDPLTFMQQSLTPINKTYLVIYISMGYFTMATELRHIVAGKYPTDEQARKNSNQFKESQIYHLLSIIIAAKFLPCASTYFDHIVNSFKTNYVLDILGLSRDSNGEMVFGDGLIFSFVDAEEEQVESEISPEFVENISEEPLPVKMKQNHLKTEEDHLKISRDLGDIKKKRGSKSKSMKNLAKSVSANNLLLTRPNKTQDLNQLLLQNKMKSSRKKSLSKTNLIFKQRRPDKSAKHSNDLQNINRIASQRLDQLKPKSQKKVQDSKNCQKPLPIDTKPLHSVKNKLMKPVKGKPREEEKKKSQRNLPPNARHSRYEDSNSLQEAPKSHRTPGKASVQMVARSKQKSKKLKSGRLQNQGQQMQSLYHTIGTPKKKTARQLK